MVEHTIHTRVVEGSNPFTSYVNGGCFSILPLLRNNYNLDIRFIDVFIK